MVPSTVRWFELTSTWHAGFVLLKMVAIKGLEVMNYLVLWTHEIMTPWTRIFLKIHEYCRIYYTVLLYCKLYQYLSKLQISKLLGEFVKVVSYISNDNKRPTGLNGHLSIRDFTLTSCQRGSYLDINSPIIE